MSKKLPLYPVFHATEGVELPKDKTYYLVTSKGLYIHRKTKFGSGLVKVDGVPWFDEPSTDFNLTLPKIPSLVIGQAWEFFRQVFKKYNSEAYLTILYNEQEKSYTLYCPKQSVSHGSANYGVDLNKQELVEKTTADGQTIQVFQNATYDAIAPKDREGWTVIGTIHSHCDFDAFHSGTDTSDEAQMDGIHITLGHVNQNECSVSVEIALTGNRYKLTPEGVCSGFKQNAEPEPEQYSETTNYVGIGFHNVRNYKRERTNRYALHLNNKEAKQLEKDKLVIEEEWMPKVEKKVYVNFHQGGGKPKKSRHKFNDKLFEDYDQDRQWLDWN
jgi:hypothetical protein